jgi:hypothetical protein
MVKEAHDLGCAVFGHNIYVAGDGSSHFEEYDPYKDQFTLLSVKTLGGGSYTSMVTVEETILVFSNKVLNSLNVADETLTKVTDLPPEGDWRCPFVPIVSGDQLYILHGGKTLYEFNWKTGDLQKLIANFA